MLQDVGLAHICDGASEQGSRSSLNTLVVWNNQITYESMMALGRALVCVRFGSQLSMSDLDCDVIV